MTKRELSSEIVIRSVEQKEIDQLVQLCKSHARYEGSDYDELGKAEKLSDALFSYPEGLHCQVLVKNDNLLGYVTFIKQFSTWDARYYLYVDCLYLKPEVRGRNIGGQLMQKAREYADRKGYQEIQWQTPIDNEVAIRFYQRLGAEAKSKERFFLKVQ